MKSKFLIIPILALCCQSCVNTIKPLEFALEQAGENRSELEAVLKHYENDPEKLKAAEFLIENMPAHYSYKGDDIHKYYDMAVPILESDLTPEQQQDTLLKIRKNVLPGLEKNIISDVKVIKSDFLIYSIDHAFTQWKTRPWSNHIDFDEFCEWLLPYKVVERQELDCWRDTLSEYFSENLRNQLIDDDECNTTYRTVDIVRNEMLNKVSRFGWYTEEGYEFLSASTLKRITYGKCLDYVVLNVATYRSLGIPAIIDETPFYGRFRAGHSWDVIISDRGEQLPSEWDLATEHGKRFFPYQRFPKIYRRTYAINRDRVKYHNESAYKFPFEYCVKDVTDLYAKTSDIEIPITRDVKLAEKYCYIAIFNGHNIEWSIFDFGEIKDGKACFNKIGRNILYLAMGFDGNTLRPLNDPFILHRDGSIEYWVFDGSEKRSIDIKRKYYQERNVVEKRYLMKDGRIQAANRPDFSDAVDLIKIEDVYIPDKMPTNTDKSYRYWRYLSADNTNGSIAELAFFDENKNVVNGKPIACKDATPDIIEKAYDNNWLTNFETENPNGNWVGMDFGTNKKISFVRLVPRSDDNDIHPGDTYELKYYDGERWISLGKKTADSNVLHYDDVPAHALLWVKDYTQGWDERPFLYREDGSIEWR
ncbi:MAG: hypothetical protein MJ211_06275 [Bacteroidales bacterium]|nr:hypothetical protein [Bacteroidales bacterium]